MFGKKMSPLLDAGQETFGTLTMYWRL